MYTRKIPPALDCGLDLIGEVLYGKWKMRLLYFIGQGYHRPSELHRQIPGATRRVLQAQLKELATHEMVSKIIYPELPPRVEYNLTDLGQSLLPLISTLGQWGDKHEDDLRRVIGNNLGGTGTPE